MNYKINFELLEEESGEVLYKTTFPSIEELEMNLGKAELAIELFEEKQKDYEEKPTKEQIGAEIADRGYELIQEGIIKR